MVCYLAGIFGKIMTLNLSFKVKAILLRMSEKLTALQKKIMRWREHFENGCLEMFALFCDFVAENYVSPPIETLISTL